MLHLTGVEQRTVTACLVLAQTQQLIDFSYNTTGSKSIWDVYSVLLFYLKDLHYYVYKYTHMFTSKGRSCFTPGLGSVIVSPCHTTGIMM